MTSLTDILSVVSLDALNEFRKAFVIAAIFAVSLLGCWPAVSFAVRKFKRGGCFLALISLGFLYSAATKPSTPSVTWDDYIVNDGTAFTTNSVGTVTGVDFKWCKTNASMPGTTPLYISYRGTNETDWVLGLTTTAGALAANLTLADAEGKFYIVWHEWVPPTPVHTNGVWLGNVLEKAQGTQGVDKMIIIHGQLMNNGKVIAP